MEDPRGDDHVDRFVLELLGTGSILSELVGNLVDALPDDAYPGERPAAVVIEMLCGTIATALESVDPQDVERSTELIHLARARTLEHLKLTCELSDRIHGDDGSVGRSYG